MLIPAVVRDLLGQDREDLACYRTFVPESPDLGAVEVIIECRSGGFRKIAEEWVRGFLERFGHLAAALALLRQVQEYDPKSSLEIAPVIGASIDAVLRRLDPRWRLWTPLLGPLVSQASGRQRRRLRRKIHRFLRDAELSDEDREALQGILNEIKEIVAFERLVRRMPPEEPMPWPPEPESARLRRRRRKPADEHQLPLPGFV